MNCYIERSESHSMDIDEQIVRASNNCLVVEDNPVVRLTLREMLKHLGYSADFAKDGKLALSTYHANYALYELILMDIEIPYITGIEVTKRIRKFEKQHQLRPVPIVGITSHSGDPEYQKKCLLAGMNKVLGKPNAIQLKALFEEYKLLQKVY